jgi:hypothetical protein
MEAGEKLIQTGRVLIEDFVLPSMEFLSFVWLKGQAFYYEAPVSSEVSLLFFGEGSSLPYTST